MSAFGKSGPLVACRTRAAVAAPNKRLPGALQAQLHIKPSDHARNLTSVAGVLLQAATAWLIFQLDRYAVHAVLGYNLVENEPAAWARVRWCSMVCSEVEKRA